MGSPPPRVCTQRTAASPAGKPLPPGTEWIPLILAPRPLSDAWPWSSLRLYSQCPASSSPSAQVQAHAPAGHTRHLQGPAVSWTCRFHSPGLLTLRGTKWPLGTCSGRLKTESKDHAARAVASVQSRGPAQWEREQRPQRVDRLRTFGLFSVEGWDGTGPALWGRCGPPALDGRGGMGAGWEAGSPAAWAEPGSGAVL